MQNFRDYYKLLGVTRDASFEEIKKAFKQAARKWHPDVNPGNKDAEEKFKEIKEAYDILSDEERRSEYDKYSRYWQKFDGKSNRPRAKTWAGLARSNPPREDYAQFADFNGFIDELLNRRREAKVGTPTGSRERVAVATTDTYRTTNKKVAYTVPSRQRRDIEARLTLPLEKAYSGGSERIRLEDGRSLEVEMPPGMISGQRIRLKDLGIGGGDLYLVVTVAPHPVFAIAGSDVICPVPITPSEAVLGSEVEVPTLDGLVKIKLPPGVAHGKRLRMANKGYPNSRGDRGDQIVEIQIATPQELTPEERELYEKLRQIETFKPRATLSKS